MPAIALSNTSLAATSYTLRQSLNRVEFLTVGNQAHALPQRISNLKGGEHWELSILWGALSGAKLALVRGALYRLLDPNNYATINIANVLGYTREGTATSLSTGSATSVGSRLLNIGGSGTLKAGDMLSVSNHLKVLTTDWSSGNANISPPWSKVISSGTTVFVITPTIQCYLADAPRFSLVGQTGGENVMSVTADFVERVDI